MGEDRPSTSVLEALHERLGHSRPAVGIPAADRGTRYHGLVRLDDHWAWVPKPWSLLPRE